MFYTVIPVFKQNDSYECVTIRQNYKRYRQNDCNEGNGSSCTYKN